MRPDRPLVHGAIASCIRGDIHPYGCIIHQHTVLGLCRRRDIQGQQITGRVFRVMGNEMEN